MNFLINPVIHPFIQILITFFLCTGILKIGKLINQKYFKNYNYHFFNLSIASIILSQLLLISFVLGYFKITVIFLSYSLIFLGILNLNFLKEFYKSINPLFKNKNNLLKIILIISFLSFIFISLGPPSMSDALDYHYGVPLYLLNYSTFPNQDIWLHGSLFGIGELLNAIGLYLKTDNFFSFNY